jgi:hypothetical protein
MFCAAQICSCLRSWTLPGFLESERSQNWKDKELEEDAEELKNEKELEGEV